MPVTVIKLGSSIVATDEGEVRAQVLASVCDVVATLEDVVVVTKPGCRILSRFPKQLEI